MPRALLLLALYLHAPALARDLTGWTFQGHASATHHALYWTADPTCWRPFQRQVWEAAAICTGTGDYLDCDVDYSLSPRERAVFRDTGMLFWSVTSWNEAGAAVWEHEEIGGCP